MTIPRAWPERLMVVAAALLAVDSFLPWYTVRWSTRKLDSGLTTDHAVTASAWTGSTGWTVGVLLTLVAAAGWLLGARLPRFRGPARWFSLAPGVAAVVVTAGTWLAIPSTSEAGGATLTFQPSPLGGTALGIITRDALTARETNVSWGYYVGLMLMAAVTVCLAVAIRRAADRAVGRLPA